MDFLHTKLARKFDWYAKWHDLGQASLLHFIILAAAVSATVLLLQAPLKEYTQLQLAATNQSFQLGMYDPNNVLVKFERGSAAAEHSKAYAAIGGKLQRVIHGGDATGGELNRVTLGQGVTVEKAIAILSRLPGVTYAEPDYYLQGDEISNDPSVTAGTTWGLYGDQGTPTNANGSQATEAWAAGRTGSLKVAVGSIDSGVQYTHGDLYLNIWLNQNEIPTAFRSSLVDVNGDGLITFIDLNDGRNAAYVTDKNANARIDAGDLLNDSRWENGQDNDANGYVDDLVGWDFVNNDNDPMDDHSHGTHTSGTMGAIGGNGVGVAGVNWTVQIIPLKFLNASNYGYTSNAIRAGDYFTNAAKANTNVKFAATNSSWGGASFSTAHLDSITRAAKENILFVVSAMNNGSNNDVTAGYPTNYSTAATAGYEAVISVAALTSTGALASWSNYGPTTVDIAAPGAGIYSTTWSSGGASSYTSKSGTSMAAPHVTGAVALYLATHPGTGPAQVRNALLASALPTSSVNGKVASNGRLDVATFVGVTDVLPPPPPPPPPTDTAAPTASLTFPANGATVSGAINVLANASDDVDVAKVELLKNGLYFKPDTTAPYSFFWDTLNVAGTYTLQARAYDAVGNVGLSNIISVTVQAPEPTASTTDTIAPVVTITSPANGHKVKGKGALSISVSATDAGGISTITIFGDNVPLATCTSVNTCSTSWATKSLAAGTHTITATAADNASPKNSKTTSITITK